MLARSSVPSQRSAVLHMITLGLTQQHHQDQHQDQPPLSMADTIETKASSFVFPPEALATVLGHAICDPYTSAATAAVSALPAWLWSVCVCVYRCDRVDVGVSLFL